MTGLRSSVYLSVTVSSSPGRLSRAGCTAQSSMYPCSLRIRATSRLSLEEGMVKSWCWALRALRRRVRKSDMGSVIDMLDRSPARLGHPGHVPVVGQLAQADPAHAEFAVDRARAPAAAA